MRYRIPINSGIINIENNTAYDFEHDLENYLNAQLEKVSKLSHVINEQALWNITVKAGYVFVARNEKRNYG